VQSAAKVDGVSLAPVLRGTESLDRDALYWHYPHYSNQGGRPGGAVRSGVYKLIEFYEQGRRELFNVKIDPGESRTFVERQPEVAKRPGEKLTQRQHEVGPGMMPPNPNSVLNPQAAAATVPLPARAAEVHGVQLRYEPLPHKDTLGYWTRADDWASWEFQL